MPNISSAQRTILIRRCCVVVPYPQLTPLGGRVLGPLRTTTKIFPCVGVLPRMQKSPIFKPAILCVFRALAQNIASVPSVAYKLS
jgi:hypothetical protein